LNYLAHIFLSGKSKRLQIGNFIGDFVKGSKLNNYPKEIKQGIVLHRLIDEFTDNHEIVKETINYVRPTFGRYSGIIVDMYFDYFLAQNFSKYSKQKSLHFLANTFYISAMLNYNYLPSSVRKFIFHFIFTDRLYKYKSLEGLRSSLQIMESYKISALNPDKIIDFLVENHEALEKKFLRFFPELIEFSNNHRANF